MSERGPATGGRIDPVGKPAGWPLLGIPIVESELIPDGRMAIVGEREMVVLGAAAR